jgi:hypothetical protein
LLDTEMTDRQALLTAAFETLQEQTDTLTAMARKVLATRDRFDGQITSISFEEAPVGPRLLPLRQQSAPGWRPHLPDARPGTSPPRHHMITHMRSRT